MSRPTIVLATAIIAVASGCSGTPTPAGSDARSPSARRGEALAMRICNDCHQVSPSRPSRSEDAGVSFMDMAQGRNRTDLMLLLTQWHGLEKFGLPDKPMPTFILTREEREDVAAYILTMRRDKEEKEARRPD